MRATVLIVLAFPTLGAQGTPEETMRAFLNAAQERRWAAAARLLEVAPIVEQRAQTLALARRPFRLRGADEIARNRPEMPRAVAEYFAAQAAQARERFDPLRYEFDVRDTTELKSLTVAELAERWLRARDPREALKRSYQNVPSCARGGDRNALTSDSLLAEMAPRSEVLGSIQRGDTAWVVLRDVEPRDEAEAAAAAWSSQPRVAVLHRGPAGWRIDPRHLEMMHGSISVVDCMPADSVTVPPLR